MTKLSAAILLALSMGSLGVANAQDLTGYDGSSTFDQSGKPTRGMTRDSVQANFGGPRSSTDAIGDPPISRWEYAGFVVFFEHDRVIHSVTKR